MTSSSSSAVDGREFGYTRRDFERVRRLIHERAGISLADSKMDMVYGRLTRRLRALGLPAVSDYLDRLEAGGGGEWQEFTNALTTNLTAFFREPHHFEILHDLLARIPRGQGVTLWCAAASTGEEPYSMAMTALEYYDRRQPTVRILATDVDTKVLETASRGIYPLERVARMPEPRLKRFFRRGTGQYEGYCRVSDELRKLITFRPLNLLEDGWPVRWPLDAIFFRNVMIYFDKPTQYRILQKFRPLLAPDGLLFAGHSESFLHAADLFSPCGRTVYRRADAIGAVA